jgi:arylsulfatase A-like enzyme
LGGIPWADGGSNRGGVEEPPGPPDKTARHPGNQGFDEWFSAGNWFDLDYQHMYHNGEAVGPLKGAPADIIMDRALDFIRTAAARKQPFLAVIWFPEPHGPHIALENDKALYKDSPQDADYYGEITAVDRNIGRLREALRRLDIHRNTMLWFNSDNGAIRRDSTGGLSGSKGNLLEGGIRVPGILEWPARIPKPFATSVPVCTVDFYPTILDLLGVRVPNQIEPVDGISLLPLIAAKTSRRPKPLAFEIRDPKRGVVSAAVMDSEYKLYRGRLYRGWPVKPEGEEREYLFHVANDPAEEQDLSASKPEIVRRLRTYLKTWQQSVEKDLAAYVPSKI